MADILDLASLIDYLPPTKIPEKPVLLVRPESADLSRFVFHDFFDLDWRQRSLRRYNPAFSSL